MGLSIHIGKKKKPEVPTTSVAGILPASSSSSCTEAAPSSSANFGGDEEPLAIHYIWSLQLERWLENPRQLHGDSSHRREVQMILQQKLRGTWIDEDEQIDSTTKKLHEDQTRGKPCATSPTLFRARDEKVH